MCSDESKIELCWNWWFFKRKKLIPAIPICYKTDKRSFGLLHSFLDSRELGRFEIGRRNQIIISIITAIKYGGDIIIWSFMFASGVGDLQVYGSPMNSYRYITMLKEVLEPSALKLFNEDMQDFVVMHLTINHVLSQTGWVKIGFVCSNELYRAYICIL